MAEYIEKNDVISRICELANIVGFENPSVAISSVISVLNSMRAEDVSPIIQCKDCWMYEEGFCFSRHVGCGSVTPQRKPDDFCSYGTPKGFTLTCGDLRGGDL